MIKVPCIGCAAAGDRSPTHTTKERVNTTERTHEHKQGSTLVQRETERAWEQINSFGMHVTKVNVHIYAYLQMGLQQQRRRLGEKRPHKCRKHMEHIHSKKVSANIKYNIYITVNKCDRICTCSGKVDSVNVHVYIPLV
jgi:hypothetical protein